MAQRKYDGLAISNRQRLAANPSWHGDFDGLRPRGNLCHNREEERKRGRISKLARKAPFCLVCTQHRYDRLSKHYQMRRNGMTASIGISPGVERSMHAERVGSIVRVEKNTEVRRSIAREIGEIEAACREAEGQHEHEPTPARNHRCS